MNLLFKYFLSISNCRNRRRCLIGNLALFLCVLGHWIQPAHAEGSKELTSNGGNRAFLLYFSTANTRPTIGSIPLRTTIKVYVNAGETINLGSSANGIGNTTVGRIDYRSPSGAAASCSTTVGGRILNRTQELAGPLPASGGYTPCVITSAQTTAAGSGIWEIDFVSPNPASDSNPAAIAASGNWTQATDVGWVAAWDITVRNSSNTGSPFLGRVYSNSLALRMPDLGNDFAPLLYVQTSDGYRYQINPRRLSPYTFVLFANNNGFKSSATNAPLFRSVDFPGGTGLESGVTVQNPNSPDSGNNVTHKIFFNTPDSLLPSFASSASGSTWLLTAPIAPQPSAFVFRGAEGTAGQAGTSPLGGNFSFNSNVTGRFLITLDLNQNGTYGDANDRVLSGFATSGTNTIFWNGRDGSGAVVPANTVSYGSRITLYAGEIHFPLLDAENNPAGLTIQRLNDPVPPTSPNPDPYLVYFDDTTVGGSSTAINGVSSSAGAHSWPDNFGNNRGLDTWAYYPSSIAQLNGGVTLRQADLEVVSKTHTPVALSTGSTVTYTIVVRNNGPNDITNAAFTDTVPAQITGVNWSCTVSPVASGNSCGAASGTGNAINTTVSLKNGAAATYIVTGTVSSSGTLTNTARIIRTDDTTDPDDITKTGAGNNSKTDTTTVSIAPDLTITKTHTGNFTQGQTGATYTLTARNIGTTSTSGTVTVTDTLPPELIPTAASGTDWICNISGQTVICTRSTALAANASYPAITITVNVVNNAPSPVINTARVSGGGEINTGNNSASDSTTINASPRIDLDGNNSSGATGNNYQNTFTAGGGAVRAADADVAITDDKNFINSATITLTNRPNGNANENLTIDATAGGTVSGVTVSTYNAATGTITLTSTTPGTITLAQYQAIIATLRYNNTVASPNTTNRIINVQVTDSDNLISNTAISTISVTIPIITVPNLLLIKRITAINGEPIVIRFQDGLNSPGSPNNVGNKAADDNDSDWPGTPPRNESLRGAINSSTIAPTVNLKPGDEVEYTVYFLNTGAASADNVSICDFVPANQTYVGTGYNSLSTADAGGLPGTNYGIAILSANGGTPVKATNAVDGDRGQFYTSNFPGACTGTPNGNGAVVVNMGSIPHATGPGTPASSYGFIRFKAKIN